MLHSFREVEGQKFDIRYKVFHDTHIERMTVV